MTKNNNKKLEYVNQFQINREKHKNKYTVITNNLIRDERLNVIEIGIMAKILSNDDTKYILNMKTLQKESNIGEDSFYKATKHLTQLGYISKTRIKGGVKWSINEIPLKNETPSNNAVNNNSISVENPANSISVENTTCVNTTSENTTCVFNPLISNNTSGENGKPFPPENKEQKEKSNNTRGKIENFSLGLGSDLNSVSNSNLSHTIVENDLQFLIENSYKFQLTYDNCWKDLNISSYSNNYIAYAVCQRLQNNELSDIPKNIYKLLTFMVRFSKDIPDSKLWSIFINEIENNDQLIKKLYEY